MSSSLSLNLLITTDNNYGNNNTDTPVVTHLSAPLKGLVIVTHWTLISHFFSLL